MPPSTWKSSAQVEPSRITESIYEFSRNNVTAIDNLTAIALHRRAFGSMPEAFLRVIEPI
jgi:hypothetical protein